MPRGPRPTFARRSGGGPGLAEAHANLGLLLDRSGNPVEAEKHYRQSIACAPACGETHLNLGALLTGAKRFDEADSAVRCALALMPESVAAWSNLGVLQACRKQEAEAERSYRLALALDPDYPLASFNLAYLLLRQGAIRGRLATPGGSQLVRRAGHAPRLSSLARRVAARQIRVDRLRGRPRRHDPVRALCRGTEGARCNTGNGPVPSAPGDAVCHARRRRLRTRLRPGLSRLHVGLLDAAAQHPVSLRHPARLDSRPAALPESRT
jgi:tetratricopeptide (TPR) repeat protein